MPKVYPILLSRDLKKQKVGQHPRPPIHHRPPTTTQSRPFCRQWSLFYYLTLFIIEYYLSFYFNCYLRFWRWERPLCCWIDDIYILRFSFLILKIFIMIFVFEGERGPEPGGVEPMGHARREHANHGDQVLILTLISYPFTKQMHVDIYTYRMYIHVHCTSE